MIHIVTEKETRRDETRWDEKDKDEMIVVQEPFDCSPNERTNPWTARMFRGARWLPFCIIILLVAFSYYAFVITLGIQYTLLRRHDHLLGAARLIVYHLLAGLMLWSLIAAVSRGPGSPKYSLGFATAGGGETGRGVEEGRGHVRAHAQDDEATRGLLEEAEEEEDSEGGRGPVRDSIHLAPSDPIRRRQTSASPAQQRLLANLTVKSDGTPRWCSKCRCPKPDRTHHCSSCGICVLRMDHHCPWLANRCVGLRNHKPFFLFITYCTLLCIFCAVESGRGLFDYVAHETDGFETSPISWALLLILTFVMSLSLAGFTFYHLYLILHNRTTLEQMEGLGRVGLRRRRRKRDDDDADVRTSGDLEAATERRHASDEDAPVPAGSPTAPRPPGQRSTLPGRSAPASPSWRPDELLTREERRALKQASALNIYDVGWRRNWTQVMGNSWWRWAVPVDDVHHDGITFPVDPAALARLEQLTAEIRLGFRDRSRSRSPSRSPSPSPSYAMAGGAEAGSALSAQGGMDGTLFEVGEEDERS